MTSLYGSEERKWARSPPTAQTRMFKQARERLRWFNASDLNVPAVELLGTQ
jgi:aminoglycoside phosphotransferase